MTGKGRKRSFAIYRFRLVLRDVRGVGALTNDAVFGGTKGQDPASDLLCLFSH